MKKRVAAVIMAVLMTVGSLAGCGKGMNSSANNNSVDNGEKYVYIPTEKKTASPENCFISSSIRVIDNRIHYISVKTDKEEGAVQETQYISTDTQGGDEKKVILENTDNNSFPEDFFLNDDGGITVFSTSYDEKSGTQQYTATTYNQSGKRVSEVSFADVLAKMSGEFVYIDTIFKTKDGKFVMSGQDGIYLADAEGKFEKSIPVNGYINRIFMDGEDNVYVQGYFENSNLGSGIAKVDLQKGSLGDRLENAPENVNQWISIDKTTFLTVSDSALGKYDIATQTYEECINWIDNDLDIPWNAFFWQEQDGNFGYVGTYWGDGDGDNGGLTIVKLTKTLDTGNRKVLTIGTVYTSEKLKNMVRNFNRTNTDYKLVIKAYEEEYGWEESGDKLLNDITQGGILDIVDTSAITKTIKQSDYFVDLNPYIDKDSEIKRENFFENVLKAQEVGGHLYSFSPTFSIYSLVGNSKYVGTGDSWTTADFKALSDSFDGLAFGSMMDVSVLVYYMSMFNSDIMDLEKGTCNFNSQAFIDVLNVAKEYPAKVEYSDDYDEFKEIQEERTILMPMYISDFDALQVYDKLLDGKMNLIGFPTEAGSGHYFMFSEGYAILNNCSDKDGAWQFIRSFFLEDGQREFGGFSFPVNKAQFEKTVERAKSESYGGTWSSGGVAIEVEGVREQDIDMVRSLMEIAQRPGAYNDDIYEILEEELKPLTSGDKSPEEVASVLQSRVSLYLAENN